MKLRIVTIAALCSAGIYAQENDKIERIPRDAAGGTLQRGVPLSELPGRALGSASNAGSSNLIDHGGRILPNSDIYYIWWGNQNVWPNDATTGLTNLATSLNGSHFMNDIFPQYMRGANVSTQFAGSWYDVTSPPSHGPKTSTIVNEACKMIAANKATADPNAVYMVLTSNFPSGANYCAWHGAGTCNGTMIQVAYQPNTTGVAGCNDPVFTCNTYSQGTNSIANVLSHEFSEAITDADLNAWYDGSGSEIGDKCAWRFQACVDLGGRKWQLQTEWSNASSGCVQQ